VKNMYQANFAVRGNIIIISRDIGERENFQLLIKSPQQSRGLLAGVATAIMWECTIYDTSFATQKSGVLCWIMIKIDLSHLTNRPILGDSPLIIIVIVNSIFLQRPQKRCRGNQLIKNKIDWQRVRAIEAGRQADSQTAMIDGVWSWDGEGGREKRTNQNRICWRAVS